MPRKTSQAVLKRDSELLPLIQELKSDHPFWGYRRIWATLRYKYGLCVNEKRIARMLSIYSLGARRPKCKALRSAKTVKPRPTKAREWWGIDMTKVLTESGWVYITLVVDWFSKMIVGYHAGYQSKSEHWLSALEMGLKDNFPYGVRTESLNLMSDNGSQPTSRSFMKTCGLLGIQQAFTSYNNPKGNADTERMMLTIKQELLWLCEWTSLEHIHQHLDNWIYLYNTEYLHSSLGYKTPQSVHENTTTFYGTTLLKVA